MCVRVCLVTKQFNTSQVEHHILRFKRNQKNKRQSSYS